MDEQDRQTERFEAQRGRLKAVATRMLGSGADADEAVQETWIRFDRADTGDVDDLGSWLTTVVSRVCLNMLQARRVRPEPHGDAEIPDRPAGSTDGGSDVGSNLGSNLGSVDGGDPEDEAVLAESIGLALLVVLDTLSASERVALVLHDMFGVPFDEIAPIVGRSVPAARQLASRARRRVRGGASQATDRVRQAMLVDAFLAAARGGDFEGLLALLDPDIVMYADEVAAQMGVGPEVRGARQVGEFARRFGGSNSALVDGEPGAVWMPGGQPRVVLHFTVRDDRVATIELVADPERLDETDLVLSGAASTYGDGW